MSRRATCLVTSPHNGAANHRCGDSALRISPDLSERFGCSMPAWAGRRCRPEAARRCCQSVFGPSERLLMNFSTTCCSAGLWASGWTTRCGRRRPLPRTASGCWPATSRRRSLPRDGPGAGGTVAVGRALHRRWHVARSGRQREEFSEEGHPGRPAGRSGNPTVNFHGERRSNATHRSTTDPESRLLRKANGHEAKLQYVGGLLMENRHGLVRAGHGRRGQRDRGARRRDRAGRGLAAPAPRRSAATRALTNGPFVDAIRATGATPHVAAKAKDSAIDGRTTRHPGYAVSQRIVNGSKRSSGG